MPGQIWIIFLVQKRFQLLDVNLEVFKIDDNKDSRLVQNLEIGEEDFNQFMRLRYQPVIAAEMLLEGKTCQHC